jgi:hypothetical protein
VLYLLNATRLASIYNTQQSAVKERNVHGYSYYVPPSSINNSLPLSVDRSQLTTQRATDIEHIASKSNQTTRGLLILVARLTAREHTTIFLLCQS